VKLLAIAAERHSDYFGSSALIAGSNSSIGCAAFHMRSKCTSRTTSPLSVRPPRSTRFGSPLVLSRVHWVEPKLVAEITYVTWTADNLVATHSLRRPS
jgi:hypothetical protein